jgi:hypothetical protein
MVAVTAAPVRLEDKLEGLRTQVVRMIREQTGLHEQFALPIAAKIIEVFFREVAGERVYVPLRDPDIAEKVIAEFNGKNRDDLLAKYGIDRATFYRYLKRGRLRPSLSPVRDDQFSI